MCVCVYARASVSVCWGGGGSVQYISYQYCKQRCGSSGQFDFLVIIIQNYYPNMSYLFEKLNNTVEDNSCTKSEV